jgi:hypothetical protein
MASIDKIKETIAEIAQRPKNTMASEIGWVVTQLGENGYAVKARTTSDGVRYVVGHAHFGVCTHNRGSKQVKRCYVDDFLDAMIELGLYEE